MFREFVAVSWIVVSLLEVFNIVVIVEDLNIALVTAFEVKGIESRTTSSTFNNVFNQLKNRSFQCHFEKGYRSRKEEVTTIDHFGI